MPPASALARPWRFAPLLAAPVWRRLLSALALLSLGLATGQCGGNNSPRPAAQPTYSARFSIAGIGHQPGVDMPRIGLELLPCSPVEGQATSLSCGGPGTNRLVHPNGEWYETNVPPTPLAITGGNQLSGQTL
jgi:hypothetical protein